MSIQPVPLRGLLRPTSILALFCRLLTFPGVLRAAEPSASRDLVPVCWSPTELAKDTEQKTWYHAPDAFAASPEDAPPNLRGVIRAVRVTSARKPVALTFDLCEGPYEVAGFDGRIPDYLRANNIHATFFVGGKWIKTHQARAKQLMSDPLFELGNHTWAHSNLRTLSRLAITDEVKKAQIAYEQTRAELTTKQCVARDRSWLASNIAPEKMRLFRFPFGSCNEKSLDAVNAMGMFAIQWDISSDDANPAELPNRMKRNIMTEVHPGAIILFHANGRGWHTNEALPGIVSELSTRGYEFVTVSELLKLGTPVIVPTCYDRIPGDTDKYDKLTPRIESPYQHKQRGFGHLMGARGRARQTLAF